MINPLSFHHVEELANVSVLRLSEELTAALGAFEKLQKAIINFAMSHCPSLCPHGTTEVPVEGFS